MVDRPQTLRPSKQQQIRDFLLGSFAKGVYSFIGGTATAALAKINPRYAALGLPVFVASSAILNYQGHENRTLYIHNFYRHQLAALGGKPVLDWTLEDTKNLLETHKDDPRFAAFKELREIDRNVQHNSLLTGVAVGALTSIAAYCGAKRGIPREVTFVGAGAGVISGSINQLFFNEDSANWPNSVNRIIKDLADKNMNGPLSPLDVLRVYAKAQPAINAKFQQRFGHSYKELNFPMKTKALAMVDVEYGITEVTNKINNGVISVRELGWLAYGMHSGVPEQKPQTIYPAKPGQPLAPLPSAPRPPVMTPRVPLLQLQQVASSEPIQAGASVLLNQ